VVLAQDPAAAVQGVPVQVAGGLHLAQRAQIPGQVDGGAQGVGVIRRTDNDNWAVPGGGMDLGESITDAAVRETREETGISCEITGLVGIYTNPQPR